MQSRLLKEYRALLVLFNTTYMSLTNMKTFSYTVSVKKGLDILKNLRLTEKHIFNKFDYFVPSHKKLSKLHNYCSTLHTADLVNNADSRFCPPTPSCSGQGQTIKVFPYAHINTSDMLYAPFKV